MSRKLCVTCMFFSNLDLHIRRNVSVLLKMYSSSVAGGLYDSGSGRTRRGVAGALESCESDFVLDMLPYHTPGSELFTFTSPLAEESIHLLSNHANVSFAKDDYFKQVILDLHLGHIMLISGLVLWCTLFAVVYNDPGSNDYWTWVRCCLLQPDECSATQSIFVSLSFFYFAFAFNTLGMRLVVVNDENFQSLSGVREQGSVIYHGQEDYSVGSFSKQQNLQSSEITFYDIVGGRSEVFLDGFAKRRGVLVAGSTLLYAYRTIICEKATKNIKFYTAKKRLGFQALAAGKSKCVHEKVAHVYEAATQKICERGTIRMVSDRLKHTHPVLSQLSSGDCDLDEAEDDNSDRISLSMREQARIFALFLMLLLSYSLVLIGERFVIERSNIVEADRQRCG